MGEIEGKKGECMSDKERILLAIINRFIPYLTTSCREDNIAEHNFFDKKKYEKGDLVVAFTTIKINPFCVGFVEEDMRDEEGYVLIREIGSNKTCEYYNETFIRLNKEKLGYEILEGTQYKTYIKVLKAFGYTGYWIRFLSIVFDENLCTVKARRAFENDEIFSISFRYNSKTSIKSIADMLIEKEKEWEDERNRQHKSTMQNK